MWGALLRVELSRRARSGQEHRLRVAWGLTLFGILAGLYAVATLAWHLDAEVIGGFLMAQVRDGETLIVGIIAPLLGAMAMLSRERSGQLAVESLTKMTAWQRWVEETLAGSWALSGLILSTMPALMLCYALGGVGIGEVLLTVLGCLVVAWLLSTVGALFALVTHRMLWAWLLVLFWGWATLIAAPAVVDAAHGAASVDDWVMAVRVGWQPVPALADGVAPLSSLWAAGLGSRADALLGVGVGIAQVAWAIVRGSAVLRRVGSAAVGRVRLLPIVGGVGLVALGFLGHGSGAWLADASLLLGFSGLLLEGLIGAAGLSSQVGGWSTGWWGPWIKREVRGGLHAGVGLVGWWVASGAGLAMLVLWWRMPHTSTRDAELPVAVAMLLCAAILTQVSCMTSVQGDRRAGGFLAMTPGGPSRLLWARLLGVGARTLPLFVLCTAWAGWDSVVWGVSAWWGLSNLSLALGWGLRRPGSAWGLAVGATLVVGVAAAQASMWGDVGVAFQAFVIPPFAKVQGVHPLWSALVWLLLGSGSYTLIRHRLRRWLARN